MKLARQFVKVLTVSVESGNHFNKLAIQFVKVIAGLDRNREHFNKLTSQFVKTLAVSIETVNPSGKAWLEKTKSSLCWGAHQQIIQNIRFKGRPRTLNVGLGERIYINDLFHRCIYDHQCADHHVGGDSEANIFCLPKSSLTHKTAISTLGLLKTCGK